MYKVVDPFCHPLISLCPRIHKLTEFWTHFISSAFESSVISSAFVSTVISSAFESSVISSAYEGVPKIMHIQHKSAAWPWGPGRVKTAYDKTQKHKWWQNLKTQIVTKLNHLNCDINKRNYDKKAEKSGKHKEKI